MLVARTPRRGQAVVAATDFSDDRYPVLREAARLARGFVAPAVFVHNSEFADEKMHPFRVAERTLGACFPHVVSKRKSAVKAISEIASTNDADLVVIGTHLGSRSKEASDHVSVAARVVCHAVSSVLVVPIVPATPENRTPPPE